MNIARLLMEIKALQGAMLWAGSSSLNTSSCADVDIVRFVHDATLSGLRIRAHVHADDGVWACEADTGAERITWVPAHRVTPGAQRPRPHPFYEIADDLLRLSGNRTYTFIIGPGIGAALSVHDGKLTAIVRDEGDMHHIQGGMIEDAAYEFIGAAGYHNGSMRVHMFNPTPPHSFYAAESRDSVGLRWLPEEYAFEAKHMSLTALQERFNYPDEAIAELGELFVPSYFPFDYKKDQACSSK